jgi:hypothetical protein
VQPRVSLSLVVVVSIITCFAFATKHALTLRFIHFFFTSFLSYPSQVILIAPENEVSRALQKQLIQLGLFERHVQVLVRNKR